MHENLPGNGLQPPPHGNANIRNNNSNPMPADNEITFLGQSMNHLSSSLVGVLQQQNQTQLETTHVLGEMKKTSEETKNDIYLQSIPILPGADPSQFDNWILKVENAADITNHPITKNTLAKTEGSTLKTLKSTNLNQPWEKIKAVLLLCICYVQMALHKQGIFYHV